VSREGEVTAASVTRTPRIVTVEFQGMTMRPSTGDASAVAAAAATPKTSERKRAPTTATSVMAVANASTFAGVKGSASNPSLRPGTPRSGYPRPYRYPERGSSPDASSSASRRYRLWS
jgi:hypothetical protein